MAPFLIRNRTSLESKVPVLAMAVVVSWYLINRLSKVPLRS